MAITLDLKNRLTLAGAILGLCVPLICFGIQYTYRAPTDELLGDWLLILWPSSIMTMAVFHPGISAVIIAATSVLVNVAFYAAIGRLLATLLLGFIRLVSGKSRTTPTASP